MQAWAFPTQARCCCCCCSRSCCCCCSQEVQPHLNMTLLMGGPTDKGTDSKIHGIYVPINCITLVELPMPSQVKDMCDAQVKDVCDALATC